MSDGSQQRSDDADTVAALLEVVHEVAVETRTIPTDPVVHLDSRLAELSEAADRPGRIVVRPTARPGRAAVAPDRGAPADAEARSMVGAVRPWRALANRCMV